MPATLNPPPAGDETAQPAARQPAAPITGEQTPGEPTWEIARLYPPQGSWTVEEYFALGDRTSRPIEYVDGHLEFLPMPTFEHQDFAKWLFKRLDTFVESRKLGEVYFSPLPVWTIPTKYREPDVLFVTPEQRRGRRHATAGASLVMEIVSADEKSQTRDRVDKRAEYAAAGIPEYWIVDPGPRTVTVLTLLEDATEYAEAGVYGETDTAASVLLEGFTVSVADLFAAAED